MGTMGSILGLLKRAENWSLGSFTYLKRDYVQANRLYSDHHYIETLLPTSIEPLKIPSYTQLEHEIREYLNRIRDYCSKKFEFEFDEKPILKCWLKRLDGIYAIYMEVGGIKNIPKTLLLTSAAKPWNKTIALSLKRRGTRVIGFHHGTGMGNAWQGITSYHELSQCNVFVCPTAKSAEKKRHEHNLGGIQELNDVECVSIETSFYKSLKEKSEGDIFPDRFRKIMVVEHPASPNRYQYSSGGYFIFQLDIGLRVVDFLKKQGYEVIYKMHPEQRHRADRIFDGRADQIIMEPFEKVHSQTDAFFFSSLKTTAFGFALCTNKPIFFIDIEGTDWNPEAYELLKKRCIMIPSYFDDCNRIQFDEEYFLKELTQGPKVPDFEYVERFMFPAK
jgi:hypothetical protein